MTSASLFVVHETSLTRDACEHKPLLRNGGIVYDISHYEVFSRICYNQSRAILFGKRFEHGTGQSSRVPNNREVSIEKLLSGPRRHGRGEAKRGSLTKGLPLSLRQCEYNSRAYNKYDDE